MKKLLQILGGIFLVFIVLGVGISIFFGIAYKQYQDADAYCTSNSRAKVMEVYESAPKNKDGSAQVNSLTLKDFENQMENYYHKCMSDKDIPDEFLRFKSPYLFD